MHNLDIEKRYWGLCTNTFDEDQKHFTYAPLMNLRVVQYWIQDMEGKRILDIGGGPTSMLLKTWDIKEGRVYDPISWPSWVQQRYASVNISLVEKGGEELFETGWDEVWIYNCLQHVVDPHLIVKNAMKAAKVLRMFEWINIPPHIGHPHMLIKEELESWIGQYGYVTNIAGDDSAYGHAFHGAFYL